jgi:hypothetical protein
VKIKEFIDKHKVKNYLEVGFRDRLAKYPNKDFSEKELLVEFRKFSGRELKGYPSMSTTVTSEKKKLENNKGGK